MAGQTPPPGPFGPPPAGPPRSPQTEVLDSAHSGPTAPPPPLPPGGRAGAGGRGLRRTLIAAGAVLGLVAAGTGGYLAWQAYFGTGPQPAEALPATTIGYVSVDLDPSGKQKIAALETLRKFPAFKEHVSLGTADDLREKLFDAAKGDSGCAGLDYDRDVKPWLGDRVAVAAVKLPDGSIAPVGVLQVSDDAKAVAGLKKLEDCGADSDGSGAPSDVGFHVAGDWAILAQSDKVANQVAGEAKDHTLADDATYRKLTGATGDPGVVTAYVAPAAGDYLGKALAGLASFGSSFSCGTSESYSMSSSDGTATPLPSTTTQSCGATPGLAMMPGGLSALTSRFKDFGGAAMSLRFDSGSIKLETVTGVSEASGKLDKLSGSDRGGEEIATLPSDTAAAIGVGFQAGWSKQVLQAFSAQTGGLFDPDQLLQQIDQATGLDLPTDLETLLGSSATLSLGSDIDPAQVQQGPDGLPVALKVHGDPDAIKAVLAKLTGSGADAATGNGTGAVPPGLSALLHQTSDGDTSVVGPDADYDAAVLKDGDLGDSDAYRSVIEHSDDASAVLFVDFDAGNWVDRLVDAVGGHETGAMGYSPDLQPSGPSADEIKANLAPLKALGLSTWHADGLAHSQLTISTD